MVITSLRTPFVLQTINIPEQLTKEVTDIFNDGLKEENM